MTIGVTADSRAPGITIVSPATRKSSPGALSPVARTRNGVTATATPESASSGAIVRRGATTSAARPPYSAPSAIATSAVPMTIVLVSIVSPRYGANSRSATSSTTRTAAEAPNTSAAAAQLRQGGTRIGSRLGHAAIMAGPASLRRTSQRASADRRPRSSGSSLGSAVALAGRASRGVGPPARITAPAAETLRIGRWLTGLPSTSASSCRTQGSRAPPPSTKTLRASTSSSSQERRTRKAWASAAARAARVVGGRLPISSEIHPGPERVGERAPRSGATNGLNSTPPAPGGACWQIDGQLVPGDAELLLRPGQGQPCVLGRDHRVVIAEHALVDVHVAPAGTRGRTRPGVDHLCPGAQVDDHVAGLPAVHGMLQGHQGDRGVPATHHDLGVPPGPDELDRGPDLRQQVRGDQRRRLAGPGPVGHVPQQRPGGVGGIAGGAPGHQVLADQVLGQRHPLRTSHRVRLVLGEPCQDRPGHAGRPRVPQTSEHLVGKCVPARSDDLGTRVGPEHRWANSTPGLVDQDRAVHLPGDPDCADVVRLGQRDQQVVDRAEPDAWVRLRRPGVRSVQRPSGLLLGEGCAVGADGDHLERAGADVDAEPGWGSHALKRCIHDRRLRSRRLPCDGHRAAANQGQCRRPRRRETAPRPGCAILPPGTWSLGPARVVCPRFAGPEPPRPGPLAQLAEQRTFNPRVVGSSPTGPTEPSVRFAPPSPAHPLRVTPDPAE